MTENTTATEFIPTDEVPGPDRAEQPMTRTLQATGDGGVELVAHEPYEGTVRNHVYICDQCGHEEATEDGIGHHLATAH